MAGIFQNGVWSCGFDDFTVVAQKFDATGAGTIGTSFTRFPGGSGMQVNAGTVSKTLGTNLVSVIHGHAWACTALPSVLGAIWTAFDATANAVQINLQLGPSGSLQFYRGAGTTNPLGSASTILLLPNNVYYYLEIKTTIDGASGFVEARINGVSATSFSGNTKSTANAFFSRVDYTATNITTRIDDIYMLDTTGSAPLNAYLGDTRITTIFPAQDSANGALNAFGTQVPSRAAGAHFNNVKETAPDDDTSYLASSTINDRESFRMGALAVTGPIFFTNQWYRARKDDAGSRSLSATCTNNGVDAIATAVTMPSTYATFNSVNTTDPNTGAAWTQSGVNTPAEWGVKVIS